MPDKKTHEVLARLFAEIALGGEDKPIALNTGDVGLLRSIDKLSPADASRAANDGATIAAHAQHLRYGLSLLNRWATEGGDPFADAKWDEAWKVTAVDAESWDEIRQGLRDESQRWHEVLEQPRAVSQDELRGLIGSIAHYAYHLGAIRQIHKTARGPSDGSS